jgi:peptidoglycan lytic transglycosylase G
MGQMKRFLAWSFLFTGIFVLATLASVVWVGKQVLNEPLNLPAQEVIYMVPEQSNLSLIASEIKANGYMAWPEFLLLWAKWKDQTLIQVGEYRLQQGDTPLDLLNKLNTGKVILYQVRITEGWRFSEARKVLESDTRLRNDIGGLDDAALLKLLGMDSGYLEGWFYPDTYAFPRGSFVSALLKRAHKRMVEVLDEEWASRAVGLPLTTKEEALTLASIIEKETGLASERATIAGVFERRLQLGMRLQTDPTVIYGIENFDGNLTRANLRTPTPYNTYVNSGLPPTPIALPGREAIRAALQPEDGDALFFVSRGDGSHYFSATLDEHQEAVRRYQLQ